MKKGFTELVFILDRSGSMEGMEADVTGGFNSMLSRQKEAEGKAVVSTVLFDTHALLLHDRLPLTEVPPMTLRDYAPRGCTALLDALGDAIERIALIHRYARPEDMPERTLFVIATDGLENASRRHTAGQVRAMIGAQRAAGWEFLFLAANIDAVQTARSYGIDEDCAVNCRSDAEGASACFSAIGEAVTCARRDVPLPKSWKAAAEKDFRRRK